MEKPARYPGGLCFPSLLPGAVSPVLTDTTGAAKRASTGSLNGSGKTPGTQAPVPKDSTTSGDYILANNALLRIIINWEAPAAFGRFNRRA
jgi:hypothetical protein